MLITKLLQQGKDELDKCGVANADIDVQLLLGHCLNKSRSQLFLHASQLVKESDCKVFWSLINRRAKREPVAYILGEREFWSLPFFVNRDVLIPRPETEFLLEKVFGIVKKEGLLVKSAVDLCCGSGVISVVLALEMDTKVIAVDCSDKALRVTIKNCNFHGVNKRVTPTLSNLFSGLDNTKYPLIVSNPPYVRSNEIAGMLEPEVTDFEPNLALDGGQDGLDLIRQIAKNILHYLAPGGMFFMEFGVDQGAQVFTLFSSVKMANRYFETVKIFKDYNYRDRVLYARVNNYSE